MPQLRRLLLCLLLALAGGWTEAAFAAQVLLLLSEESSAFSEAAEAIGAELRGAGHRVHTLSLPLREDGAQLAGHALIVTLGTRAAQTVAAVDHETVPPPALSDVLDAVCRVMRWRRTPMFKAAPPCTRWRT